MKKFAIIFFINWLSFNTYADPIDLYESTDNAGISKGERIDKIESHLNEIGQRINLISEKRILQLEKELSQLKEQVEKEQTKKIETLIDKKMAQLRSEVSTLLEEQMRSVEQRVRSETLKEYEAQKLMMQKLLERMAIVEKIMNDS